MKLKSFVGALVVSVGLCGQSFGFELLDRMLGLNTYGGSCCASSCCEAEPTCGCDAAPSCCEAAPTCCEAAPTCCAAEPACGCAEAPSCCEPACDTCCHKKHRCGDLFGGLKGLFDCHKCNKGCGQASCCHAEPACGCAAEPACGCAAEPVCGCEAAPTCCEAAPTCCEAPKCCKKRHGHRLMGLFRHKHCRKSSCCQAAPSCCESACVSGGCTSGCNGGGYNGGAPAGGYDNMAPTPAAEGDDLAPMPPAPMADPSASYRSNSRVFQASKYVRTR